MTPNKHNTCMLFYNMYVSVDPNRSIVIIMTPTICHMCISLCITGADPGFQVRRGALKKIAPSGEMREKFWGISCEKSRFYAKKSFFSILGGGRAGAGCAAPWIRPCIVLNNQSNYLIMYLFLSTISVLRNLFSCFF